MILILNMIYSDKATTIQMEAILRNAIWEATKEPKRIYTAEEKKKIKAKKEEDRKREKVIQKMMRDEEIKQGWRFKNHYTEEDDIKIQRARDADPCYEQYSGRTNRVTPIQQVFLSVPK